MLKTRIITASVLLAAFLAALFYLPQRYWNVLVLFVSVVAVWEWAAIAGLRSVAKWAFFTATLLLIFILLQLVQKQISPHPAWPTLKLIFLISGGFWLLVVPLWLARKCQVDSALLLALTGWAVLIPLTFSLIYLRFFDPLLLLGVMATIWISDVAAFLVGKKFGKHKLAPSLSPGKTWEGVWGAFAAVGLYGIFLSGFMGATWWLVALAAMVIAGLGILGDLFESMMKRQRGLKDSSQLLPGHGGLLDRIDALTSSLPLAALAISLAGFY